jgi:hypothetical protein
MPEIARCPRLGTRDAKPKKRKRRFTMPTKKSKKNRVAKIAKAIKKSDSAIASIQHVGSRFSAKDIALPAAAVVGAGALAAAGFVMREELAALVDVAVESLALSKRLDPDRLLGFAGLARKRSFLSAALPELGGFAVGMASGAALMLLRSPQSKSEARSAAPIHADVASMTGSGSGNGAGQYVHPVP